MQLMSWIVLWVGATAVAVVLGYYRMTLGLHDQLGMPLSTADQDVFYRRQKSIQRKMSRVDLFGITFTVVSAILALVVVLMWAVQSAGGH